MNLEAIMLRRAEMQMQSGSWRRPDRGEARVSVTPTCEVPGCWNPIGSGRNRCDSCRDAGWVASPCKSCGGRIRRLDQTAPAKGRRGICQACRAEIPNPPGNRSMGAAHAALAAKRRAS